MGVDTYTQLSIISKRRTFCGNTISNSIVEPYLLFERVEIFDDDTNEEVE